uniref:Uncharacterized protein n=1 Tax=Alexandrium monilatum TaxID=311494 RepID=A0A7S4UZX4_9DINO
MAASADELCSLLQDYRDGARNPPLLDAAVAGAVREPRSPLLTRGSPPVPLGVPAASRPLCVLDVGLAQAVGARGGTLWLSPQTARKQASTHPELSEGDYSAVLEAFEDCLVVKEGRNGYQRHLLFLVKRGERHSWRWWKAAVKATADGSELYLVTLHPLQAREIEPICDFGMVIRPARGRQGVTPLAPSQCIF